MSTADEEINPYELLDVKLESSEAEIRRAYRQRSLKVHPDRNPNNPNAARKFHELNQAYELLLDPLRRLALDAKMRIKQARAERYKSYDNKRKNLVNELEEREQAFKKARMEKQKQEVETWQQTEKIKDEGRRLREEKEKELRNRMKQEEESMKDSETEEAPPPLDPLDTTVKLKFPLKTHPSLTSAEAIGTLLSRFGSTDIDSIVLSIKPTKKQPDKPPKYGTALVPFKQIGHAFAAVCASGRKELGLDGVEISWVGGKEPAILGWLKKMGKLSTSGTRNQSTTATPTSESSSFKGADTKADLPQSQSRSMGSGYSSFPSTFPDTDLPLPAEAAPSVAGIDYESLTLMRMRQAERERLEREILEQEANE
ncbi:DnaJ-domain-containing protein [Phlegmacium glaucopus]|nr:DnaJ-domain-containing protein [Phlegmacium glaucopus]